MSDLFYAGAAEIEITPALGLEMDGYMARVGTSAGVHDPLLAQVLVLEYQERRAALVTLDVMAVSRSFTDDVRRDLATLLGTTTDAILVCASHTHSGPMGLQDRTPIGSGQLDSRLVADVREKIRRAAGKAFERRQPVQIRSASGNVSGIGGDRNRPERPVAPRITVLDFEVADGKPAAILLHYACHPTVLSAANLDYSADFPGTARRRIRETYPDTVCLYVNGAAGNVSTRFQRRDQSFDEVERLGGLLGEQVVRLLTAAAPVAPALDSVCESVELPLREFPVEARQVGLSGNARIDTVRAEGATIEEQLRSAFRGYTSQPAEVCALHIGPTTLLSVPGEAFNDLAVSLRESSPTALVAGYANDYLGYFPTQAAIDDATYEALSSPYDVRAHQKLQERLGKLLHDFT